MIHRNTLKTRDNVHCVRITNKDGLLNNDASLVSSVSKLLYCIIALLELSSKITFSLIIHSFFLETE